MSGHCFINIRRPTISGSASDMTVSANVTDKNVILG